MDHSAIRRTSKEEGYSCQPPWLLFGSCNERKKHWEGISALGCEVQRCGYTELLRRSSQKCREWLCRGSQCPGTIMLGTAQRTLCLSGNCTTVVPDRLFAASLAISGQHSIAGFRLTRNPEARALLDLALALSSETEVSVCTCHLLSGHCSPTATPEGFQNVKRVSDAGTLGYW